MKDVSGVRGASQKGRLEGVERARPRFDLPGGRPVGKEVVIAEEPFHSVSVHRPWRAEWEFLGKRT